MAQHWRLVIMLLLIAVAHGCASLPEPPPDPDFAWIESSRLANGCVVYIKRPRRPDVMVDQALWYQRTDGSMTADADECAPR